MFGMSSDKSDIRMSNENRILRYALRGQCNHELLATSFCGLQLIRCISTFYPFHDHIITTNDNQACQSCLRHIIKVKDQYQQSLKSTTYPSARSFVLSVDYSSNLSTIAQCNPPTFSFVACSSCY